MIRTVFTVAAAAAALLVVGEPAFGLAQRTFVSTTGNDAAACSLAAPCRSFTAAIAQTAAGGEVIVLDSGGYGAVGISKDVSIIAPRGVYAGITVTAASPNATGITVYNARVILRGLSINGQGGDTGIHVFGDAVVQIEDCAISNLALDGVRIGGLLGSHEVFIHATMIHDNGGQGIYVTGAARVHVDRTSSQRNGGDGLLAINGPMVVVASSALSGNSGNGATAFSDVDNTRLTITDSTIARNAARGVLGLGGGTGPTAWVHVARNTIASNMLDGIRAEATSADGTARIHANNNVVAHNLWDGIASGSGYSAIVASNNDVFANQRIGLHRLSSGGFATRGNNTVTYNYLDQVVGAVPSIAGH